MIQQATLMADAIAQAEKKVDGGVKYINKNSQDSRVSATLISCTRKDSESDQLTIDATSRQHGYIITGLFSHSRNPKTPEYAAGELSARRWVLHHSRLTDSHYPKGGGLIFNNPAITFMNRVNVVCQACGYAYTDWYDNVIRKTRQSTTDLRCTKCAQKTTIKRMHTKILRTSGRDDIDAIFGSDKEAYDRILALMTEQWSKPMPISPEQQTTVELPKLYCVYDAADTPNVPWEPSTPTEVEIVARAAAFRRKGKGTVSRPLTIRPLGLVKMLHTVSAKAPTPVLTCWMSAPQTSIGWARMEDLINGNPGFKRRLWPVMKPVAGWKLQV